MMHVGIEENGTTKGLVESTARASRSTQNRDISCTKDDEGKRAILSKSNNFRAFKIDRSRSGRYLKDA